MADVINEVAEQATELGMEVKNMEPTIIGPTIFKTSNTAKVVFGVVAGAAAIYGFCKGARYILKKKKESKMVVNEDNINDVEEAEFTELEDED